MKIYKRSDKFPFMELTIETASGDKFDFDVKDTFKIVLLFAIIGLAYNMGAYIELNTLQYAARLCQASLNPLINLTEIPLV